MSTKPQTKSKNSLSGRLCFLAAGCCVDQAAMKRWNTDLATLKKMGEAYRAGWLHNVMSRITPLTMVNQDDYIAIADLFVETAEDAEEVLNRFDQGIEHYCQCAEIEVYPTASMLTVTPKIRAHIHLYAAINQLFAQKFGVAMRNPILVAAHANSGEEADFNPYIKEYVEGYFQESA